MAPSSSVNRTKTRFAAGSTAIGLAAPTKTAKVGVAPPAIAVVTLGMASPRHVPLPGSVWQIARDTPSGVLPVSADTVMVAGAPRLMVATAKAATPGTLGTATMPLL